MNRILLTASCLLVAISLCTSVLAQKKRSKIEIVPPKGYSPLKLENSASLQSLLDGAIRAVVTGTLKSEEIAATLIDLRNPTSVTTASVRGSERIYPASVVKMFYMNALERQLE